MEDSWENRDMNDPEERKRREELRKKEMDAMRAAREARELDEVIGPVLGIVKRILNEEELPKLAAGLLSSVMATGVGSA